MANPAAVLSILVDANTKKAQAELIGLHKSLTKTDQQAEKTAAKMKLVSAAAGGLGIALGGALAVGAKAGWEELKQAQRVTAQTEAVLKSTGRAANVTAKHVDELAQSILKKSGIDDEAVKSGENMLLTFRNIRNEAGKGNKVFDQATKVTTDLSVAMGIDMKAAALQVGKALNDPARGMTRLQRIGVTFTQQQKDAVKALTGTGSALDDLKTIGEQLTIKQKAQISAFGDLANPLKAARDIGLKLTEQQRAQLKVMEDGTGRAKAQKIILRELAAEFGGSAAKQGKTLAGQMDILRETFKNVAAEMVQGVIPAVQAMLKPLQALAKWMTDNPKQAKLVIEVLGGLTVALLGLAAASGAVSMALDLNPFVLAAAAIAALTIAVIQAYKHSEKFRNIVDSVGSAISSTFGTVVEAVSGAVSGVADEVGSWQALWHTLGAIVTAAVGIVKSQLQVLQLVVKVAMVALGPIFAAAWKLITGIFSGAMTVLKGYVSGGLKVIRGVITIFGGLLKGDFGQIWDGIQQVFRGGITAVKGLLSGMWKIIKAPVEAIGAGLKNAFSKTWDRISSIFSGAVDTMRGFINAIIDVINVLPFVNIKHVGANVGAKATSGANTLRPPSGTGGGAGRFAEGGKVSMPIAIMGEEAPRHPEWVIPTNPAYRGRALGLWAKAAHDIGVPGFAIGGSIGKAIGGAASKVANIAGSAVGAIGHLPHNPFGSGLFHKLGGYIIGKAKDYIGGLFSGGGGGSKGPAGVGVFQGIPMANWVIEALQYAQSNGVAVRPTSGYRPGFDPHTASGRSEHQGIQYPHGAVDFGGYHDSRALAMKMAVVAATSGFRYPLLAPRGFVDDGHASGTGHKRGGLVRYAGGGRFSASDLAALGWKVGFRGNGLVDAIAVALAESGGDPTALGKNYSHGQLTSVDRGLWQINSVHGGQSTFNPLRNAQAAFAISSHGHNWKPWTTWPRKAMGYIPRAQAAVRALIKRQKAAAKKRAAAVKKAAPAATNAGRRWGTSGSVSDIVSASSTNLGTLNNAISNVDLRVGAGVESAAQGIADKNTLYTAALNGGFGFLTPEDRMRIIGDQKDLNAPDTSGDPNQALIDATNAQTEAIAAQTQALAALKASVDQQNAFAASVAGITTTAALKTLADVFSGQVMGKGYAPRSRTASAGQIVRY